jgi:glycogen phosphorylase
MVNEAYLDKDEWIKKSIRTTAKVSLWRHIQDMDDRLLILHQMGKFSSDRALNEYAESYWNIEPCPVPSSA